MERVSHPHLGKSRVQMCREEATNSSSSCSPTLLQLHSPVWGRRKNVSQDNGAVRDRVQFRGSGYYWASVQLSGPGLMDRAKN
jgi:hypothetical protein